METTPGAQSVQSFARARKVLLVRETTSVFLTLLVVLVLLDLWEKIARHVRSTFILYFVSFKSDHTFPKENQLVNLRVDSWVFFSP